MHGYKKVPPAPNGVRMRSALLLLLTVVLTCSAQAISWRKSVYNLPGQGVERADFTGDGYPDLLIYDAAHITILHNLRTPQGQFDQGAPIRLNMGISSPAILEFNRNAGNGGLDIAGCGENGAGVVILLSNGNGIPTLSQTIPGPCSWVTTAGLDFISR